MTRREWKDFAIGLIDGLERQLSSSAPKAARLQLAEIRECASRATTAKARRLCERRLDRLGESTPFFRGAVRRDGYERLIESMAKLAQAHGKKEAERGIHKILADFRKKRRKPIYKPIHTLPRTATR